MQKAPPAGAPFQVTAIFTVTTASSEIGLAGVTLACTSSGPVLGCGAAGAGGGKVGAGAAGAWVDPTTVASAGGGIGRGTPGPAGGAVACWTGAAGVGASAAGLAAGVDRPGKRSPDGSLEGCATNAAGGGTSAVTGGGSGAPIKAGTGVSAGWLVVDERCSAIGNRNWSTSQIAPKMATPIAPRSSQGPSGGGRRRGGGCRQRLARPYRGSPRGTA